MIGGVPFPVGRNGTGYKRTISAVTSGAAYGHSIIEYDVVDDVIISNHN